MLRKLGVLLLAGALAFGAAAQEPITLVEVTDEIMRVQGIIPEGWQAIEGGLYASPDGALLALQTAPASLDAILSSVLPQLGLSELPEPAGTLEANGLSWTIYQTDVTSGPLAGRADYAFAERDGVTFVALLVSPPEQYETLHTQVFEPALAALRFYNPAEVDPSTLAYNSEDVTFPGGAEDVTLAGTFTWPEGDGPFTTVILLTGSGPQDRNESLRPSGIPFEPFAIIADALTNAGYAVLRYDDRGVAESTGDYESAVIFDFVDDAAAAIRYALTRPEVNPDALGVLGHSEGGIYAAALGAASPDIDFIISMAGVAQTGVELIIEQQMAILRVSEGAEETTEEEWAQLEAYTRRMIEAAAVGDFEGAEAAIRETYGWLWDSTTEEERAALALPDRDGFIQGAVDSLLAIYETPGYVSLLNVDPAADWAQTTVPVLALFGGKDVQVLAESNAAALEAALAEAGNTDVTVVTLPEANHLFQQAETGALEEYATLEMDFVPDFLPTIIEWLDARFQ
jgi:uncharacterized protein